jgi:hypothetical protein
MNVQSELKQSVVLGLTYLHSRRSYHPTYEALWHLALFPSSFPTKDQPKETLARPPTPSLSPRFSIPSREARVPRISHQQNIECARVSVHMQLSWSWDKCNTPAGTLVKVCNNSQNSCCTTLGPPLPWNINSSTKVMIKAWNTT